MKPRDLFVLKSRCSIPDRYYSKLEDVYKDMQINDYLIHYKSVNKDPIIPLRDYPTEIEELKTMLQMQTDRVCGFVKLVEQLTEKLKFACETLKENCFCVRERSSRGVEVIDECENCEALAKIRGEV